MFRQSARVNGQLQLILYGSTLYERRHIGAAVTHVHYIQANGSMVATVHRQGTDVTNTNRYLHKDHLGSVVAITSQSAAIEERLAYDAWGKRRPASTWQTPTPGVFIAAITLPRGFTLHEHLDQVGLVHMGGRVYDPELGRFLSADPFVQFPGSTQGFNRYVYVSNNPLSYTDPSGYFLKKVGIGVGIAMNFVPGMQLSNVWLHGFVSGFLVSGGNVKAGMIGMMSAGIASKVGGFADTHELGNFGRSALHGVTQGAIAKAGGGRFGDGALGAFSGSYLSFIPEAVAGPYGTGGEGAKIARMTAAAIVGGTASKIGGGKFANGAWSAAFVSRFNHDRVKANPATRVAQVALSDGHLTHSEANEIWRANNDPGFEVTVDASKLTVLQGSQFAGSNNTAIATVLGANDYAVHGQVTLQLLADGSIRILPDRYDFQPHDVSKYRVQSVGHLRNAATFAGFGYASRLGLQPGTDFSIRYRGQPNVIKANP